MPYLSDVVMCIIVVPCELFFSVQEVQSFHLKRKETLLRPRREAALPTTHQQQTHLDFKPRLRSSQTPSALLLSIFSVRVLENDPSSSVSPAAVDVCDCVVSPGQRLVSSPLKRTHCLFCFYFCHFSSEQREKSLCALDSWWDKRRRCEDVTSGFGHLWRFCYHEWHVQYTGDIHCTEHTTTSSQHIFW